MSVHASHIRLQRTRGVQAVLVQIATVAALVALAAWLFKNVEANLEARSIASGFEFVRDTAGFEIGETPIAYRAPDSFARALLVGLLNTLKVSALAIAGASVLGFSLGLARLSKNALLSGLAGVYVEFVRNVPLLLQLLILYSTALMLFPALPSVWEPLPSVLLSNRGIALPAMSGAAAFLIVLIAGAIAWHLARRWSRPLRGALALAAVAVVWFLVTPEMSVSVPKVGRFNFEGGWQVSTELMTLVTGLSLYSAAYIAEIVRGGLLSVPVGQREAALSLGLTAWQSLRYVVVPQSLRAILPPLGSWYLNTVKNSSLAVAIAYPDLVSVVDTLINQTGQAIEGVAIIVGAYLSINALLALLLNWYNARVTRTGAAAGATAAMLAQPARTQWSIHSLRTAMGEQLFPSLPRAALSIVLLAIAAVVIWSIVDWLFVSAAFTGGAPACRVAAGACWPFIAENYRLILFGLYPAEEQWRALIVVLLFAALLCASFVRSLWNVRLIALWAAGLAVALILMLGGLPGLPNVPTDKWSGLPLTVILASVAVLGAVPLAVLLALSRRSKELLPRMLASGFVELMRGTPLIGVLFMAAVMFPLLLPASFDLDGYIRVQIALLLFTAAYMAEPIRAGLQAIPRGQFEAATSLGLTHAQALRHVVLPQALRTSLPGLVNTTISEVKNTTLVLIVGMFDLLQTTRLALVDIEWRPYFVEAYGFTAAVFFVICFAISQLSRRIERHLSSASAGGARLKEIA